jgi:hypothetical protein
MFWTIGFFIPIAPIGNAAFPPAIPFSRPSFAIVPQNETPRLSFYTSMKIVRRYGGFSIAATGTESDGNQFDNLGIYGNLKISHVPNLPKGWYVVRALRAVTRLQGSFHIKAICLNSQVITLFLRG